MQLKPNGSWPIFTTSRSYPPSGLLHIAHGIKALDFILAAILEGTMSLCDINAHLMLLFGGLKYWIGLETSWG